MASCIRNYIALNNQGDIWLLNKIEIFLKKINYISNSFQRLIFSNNVIKRSVLFKKSLLKEFFSYIFKKNTL
jgi:hypothetical protein